jgi:DnaJ family protein C protein 13
VKKNSLLLGKKTSPRCPPSKNENQTISGRVMHGLLASFSHDIAGVRAQPQVLDAILLQRLLPVATAIRHLIQFTPEMDIQVVQSDGILTLLYALDHDAQPQAFSFTNHAPLLQLRCIECLQMLSFSGKCIEPLAMLVPPFVKSAFQLVYQNLSKSDASTEGQLARITLQFLGHLCLVPSCIDNLVKGMNPNDLALLLPQIWLGDPNEMQLLLCLHMIPLRRHTQAATQFAKNAIQAQLANALLNLLSQLVPKSKLGESSLTKSYAARFLAVLSSNPGSGGAISSMLIASRVWETHGETAQGSSEDLKRLLVLPHAPSIMKSDHANPYKIG